VVQIFKDAVLQFPSPKAKPAVRKKKAVKKKAKKNPAKKQPAKKKRRKHR
jgi:hypothetical protein